MRKYISILLSVFAVLLCACSDIEGLNDYNAVFSFEITDYKGTDGDIEIGEPVMDGNTIYIPVYYGIHNFPLYIKGYPVFENPIDRVTGIDFEDWIVIDIERGGADGTEPLLDEYGNYIFQEPKFYVQALSGMPREYTFKIDYEASSSDAEVLPSVAFNSIPEGAIVADILTVANSDVSGEGNLAMLNVVNPTFPMTVTPVFTLSDGAVSEGNGRTEYEFVDGSERFQFDVKALDGTVKTWSFGMTELSVVNANTPGITEAMLERTNLTGLTAEPGSKGFSIEEYSFSASKEETAGGEGGDTDGEGDGTEGGENTGSETIQSLLLSGETTEYMPSDTIKLYISTLSSTAFPISVGLNIPVPQYVSLVGDVENMSFSSMDDTKEFWMLDTVDGIARRWVVVLEEYTSPMATVLSFSYQYTASKVSESLFGSQYPAIVMDENLTADIDNTNHCIYLRAVEVHNAGTFGGTWELEFTSVSIKVSNGASLVNMPIFVWEGNDSWKTPKTFGVQAADGVVTEWKVVIRDWTNGEPAASDECQLYGVKVREVRPYTVALDDIDPVTIDSEAHTVTLNIAEDAGGYPMSFALEYTVSEYARIASQNGGLDPLVFNSADAVNIVEVVSESGNASQEWTVMLRPPLKEVGTDVTSFNIVSFSGSGFGAELAGIDNDNAVISVNFTSVGTFPVTMNIRMGLSYKATSSITDEYGSGAIEFSAVENKTFTVTAQNGETREWTIKTSYMPQLQDYTFEQWSNSTTLLPKGIKGSPYWASANMTSPVKVEGTTQTDGAPGQGYAVQLKTQNTLIGRLAAGSLFLGWFDSSNAMGNMNDPVKMMFYGIPFSSSKQIKGMQVDVWYHPGDGASSDSGTLAIELIKQNNPGEELVFHGNRPDGTIHPDNNAVSVARGQMIVGTQAGTLDNGDTVTQVLNDSTWTTVFVPLEYDGAYPEYTHFTVTFSSSSKGDLYQGAVGSTMKLDNVRLVYEE